MSKPNGAAVHASFKKRRRRCDGDDEPTLVTRLYADCGAAVDESLANSRALRTRMDALIAALKTDGEEAP